jgi:prepilin-type processing-associated H-X9-DG protein
MSGYSSGATVRVGRSDYFSTTEATEIDADFNPIGPLYDGILAWDEAHPLAAVTDGASQTALVAEVAGFPKIFNRHRRHDPSLTPNLQNGHWAAANRLQLHGYSADGTIWLGGNRVVNATNEWGSNIHSFHPGGANLLMADGSVRFLKETIDHRTVRRYVGRNDGEIVNED